MKVLRIAGQNSGLGMAWAYGLIDAIRATNPHIVPEVVAIQPESDMDLQQADPYFAAAQRALESGQADLCVHNLEDLPQNINKNLPIVAVSARSYARDVLVCPAGRGEPDFSRPLSAKGVSRLVQLSKLYPGWAIVPAYGSTPQQLERLDIGELGAVVVPEFDMLSLGLAGRIHLIIDQNRMITMPGQGIVAVQGRWGDDLSFLIGYHNADAWDMALAERGFSRVLGMSVGFSAVRANVVSSGRITVRGIVVGHDGRQHTGVVDGARDEAEDLGAVLAVRLGMALTPPDKRRSSVLGVFGTG